MVGKIVFFYLQIYNFNNFQKKKNNVIFITFVVFSTFWHSSNTSTWVYLLKNQYPVTACTKSGASISKLQKLAQIFNP